MRFNSPYRLLGSVLLMIMFVGATNDIHLGVGLLQKKEYECGGMCGSECCKLCDWFPEEQKSTQFVMVPTYRMQYFHCVICHYICDEAIKGPALFQCSHNDYCGRCIFDWVNKYKNESCPLCRKGLQPRIKKIHKSVGWFKYHHNFHLFVTILLFIFMDWALVPSSFIAYNHVLMAHFFISLVSMMYVKFFTKDDNFVAIEHNYGWTDVGSPEFTTVDWILMPEFPNLQLGDDPCSAIIMMFFLIIYAPIILWMLIVLLIRVIELAIHSLFAFTNCLLFMMRFWTNVFIPGKKFSHKVILLIVLMAHWLALKHYVGKFYEFDGEENEYF